MHYHRQTRLWSLRLVLHASALTGQAMIPDKAAWLARLLQRSQERNFGRAIAECGQCTPWGGNKGIMSNLISSTRPFEMHGMLAALEDINYICVSVLLCLFFSLTPICRHLGQVKMQSAVRCQLRRMLHCMVRDGLKVKLIWLFALASGRPPTTDGLCSSKQPRPICYSLKHLRGC